MTSTRTKGFSTCPSWASQAFLPSASSRRSSTTNGVWEVYHSTEASMSEHGRAMWVQRGRESILTSLAEAAAARHLASGALVGSLPGDTPVREVRGVDA